MASALQAVGALRGPLHGEDPAPVSPAVAKGAAARLLTERQVELLRLAAMGHDNSSIARRLTVSRGTVRRHLENIYARLGVSSRAAAVAHAFPGATWVWLVATGWLKPNPRSPAPVRMHRPNQ